MTRGPLLFALASCATYAGLAHVVADRGIVARLFAASTIDAGALALAFIFLVARVGVVIGVPGLVALALAGSYERFRARGRADKNARPRGESS